jgi:hypothetical protein
VSSAFSPARATNSPLNSPRPISGWPARSVTSTIIRSPTCRIGASRSLAHGRARWNSVPAATRQRIGTSPRSGLMSRASSAQGSGPFAPWLSESMTRTAPSRVLNVVSSTPSRESSIAANTGGESIAGAAHQSIAPSRATSAIDLPSPMTP